jgi:hypothetical protein
VMSGSKGGGTSRSSFCSWPEIMNHSSVITTSASA